MDLRAHLMTNFFLLFLFFPLSISVWLHTKGWKRGESIGFCCWGAAESMSVKDFNDLGLSIRSLLFCLVGVWGWICIAFIGRRDIYFLFFKLPGMRSLFDYVPRYITYLNLVNIEHAITCSDVSSY